MKNNACLYLLFGLLFILSGCTIPNYVAVKDIDSRAPVMSNVVLIEPDVKIYEVDA